MQNRIINNGNSQLLPEVVRYPHFEVPYPQLKRRQQSLGALVAVVRPFRYIYLWLKQVILGQVFC